MAFWLASRRDGQDSDWLQRFDPRFWTVNFPRPMMASVVSTGPDSLRVDAEFHRKSDLAGLIWDSEDRWSHPLLAYETRRDYRGVVLSFEWASGGSLAPLGSFDGKVPAELKKRVAEREREIRAGQFVVKVNDDQPKPGGR